MRVKHLDTKFVIRGRIQAFADQTNSEIARFEDDFEALLAIVPKDLPQEIQSGYELFTYVNSPEPMMHVLSTHPSRLEDLAAFLHWLKVRPEDVACETDWYDKPLADIGLVQRVMREAYAADAANALPGMDAPRPRKVESSAFR